MESWVILSIVIFIFIFGVFKIRNSFELFLASNVFKVPIEQVQGQVHDTFPINDPDLDITPNLEQNKDTFDSDLKDILVRLTQLKIDGVNKKIKVFKDSMEKIFVDAEFKNIVFNINAYNTTNFFVYKIKVSISSETKIDKNCINCTVKMRSVDTPASNNNSIKFVPVEEPSVPVYFRILNTLHLLDPFKTSSSLIS